MVSYRLVTTPTARDAESVWRVYDAVFDDQPDEHSWREQVWDPHTVDEVGDGYRVRTVRVTSPNGVVHWFEGPNELA